ncbi:hypothetical protein K7640_08255 [Micromonospora sp. PLK6-60]|uniref:hypothetical protein n=1 Tax=Micromonospora sp. PLK6-60 TaxID=2873383 RepID=UPI001CA61F20|nr:hypothetical protein [Micromonospora sp. PLK6-60]MBY8871831.1 hypothetical protein [Micromonospora sp. PLK6-60]
MKHLQYSGDEPTPTNARLFSPVSIPMQARNVQPDGTKERTPRRTKKANKRRSPAAGMPAVNPSDPATPNQAKKDPNRRRSTSCKPAANPSNPATPNQAKKEPNRRRSVQGAPEQKRATRSEESPSRHARRSGKQRSQPERELERRQKNRKSFPHGLVLRYLTVGVPLLGGLAAVLRAC